ncbi:protein MHF1 homolog isoform X2 [Castanea sativa]|uniref:protein MHF1 homolog isoform X2 n=1 Tax=Castanea sativa TaxID=21020 RepID=UPI003F650EEB
MEKAMDVEMEREGGGEEEEEETESVSDVLRDRFRLSTISIAEAEAKRNGMEISEPIVACISDLAFKYAEQLAKDLELFAQHASRKIVKMEDVVLSAHRNEHLAASLRSLCDDLKAKEPQSERKRKKTPRKENKATTSVVHIPDN